MSNIFNVVIGTAGHIDHGKSTLVFRLTGINPDRLKEEQERGMTIDLGFAPLTLPNGQKIGIVDVPGHERFIKNMVAGATGIDFVILVVAADDGIMPQTREHLEIMQMLEIQRGMVALTKIDMVDPELAELAQEELREFLRGTFLQDAPIMPISSVTGQGWEQFCNTLFTTLETVTPKSTTGIFRMPIQRVFSSHGHGTVITGIPLQGCIQRGDTLEILPQGLQGRIKKIQAYSEDVEEARAGHSTALNLADVDYKVVGRGNVAALPGYFQAASFIEAKFLYLPSLRHPLKHMSHIRFHAGTSEVMGRIAILGQPEFEPGHEGYVQICLEEPLVVVPNDRFVVRLSSPTITIGGGIILSSGRRKLKQFRAGVVQELQEKERALENEEERLSLALKSFGPVLVREGDWARASKLETEKFQTLASQLVEQKLVWKQNTTPTRYLHATVYQQLADALHSNLEDFFAAHPHLIYMNRLELKNRLKYEAAVLDFVLEQEIAQQQLAAKGDKLQLPERQSVLTPQQTKLIAGIEQAFAENKFSPPGEETLCQQLRASWETLSPLVQTLVEREALVEVERGLFFHREALIEARQMIIAAIEQQGELISAEFRDRLATSRKYVIPLLYYFDRIGLTIREGSSRVLKP